MMSRFGRRTVLQLNDGKKKESSHKAPTGFGGLVQYGDDYSDSDEEGTPAAATPTKPSSPAGHNGDVPVSRSVSASPERKATNNTMDVKLADFLAEIESISTDNTDDPVTEKEATTLDKSAANSPSPSPTPPHISEQESSSEEEETFDVPKPSKPETCWQHCLDEGTQHYYYWNTITNKVTWEIPDDFSKYLLFFKEYEEKMKKYESLLKTFEDNKNLPKALKKKKTKAVVSGPLKPLVSYDETPEPTSKHTAEPKPKVNVELVPNLYHAGLGFSKNSDTPTFSRNRNSKKYPVSFVKGGTVTSKLPELLPKSPVIDTPKQNKPDFELLKKKKVPTATLR